MRETWLSSKRVRHPGGQYVHISHLFVIGNDRRQAGLIESIRNESMKFNDILMIDVQEEYKNLVYKHLAIVNWVSFNF